MTEGAAGLPFRPSWVRRLHGLAGSDWNQLPAVLSALQSRIQNRKSKPSSPSSPSSSSSTSGTGDATDELVRACEVEPGWALFRLLTLDRANTNTVSAAGDADADMLFEALSQRTWWLPIADPGRLARERLWRYAVAVSRAARRLAREMRRPDPDGDAMIALLSPLAAWMLAAWEPDRLILWLDAADPRRRQALEREWCGGDEDFRQWGQRLVQRWGGPAALAEAVGYHAEPETTILAYAEDPVSVQLIRQACDHVALTPFALFPTPWPASSASSSSYGRTSQRATKQKVLIAEVQSRCGDPLAAWDVQEYEVRAVQAAARLQKRCRELTIRHEHTQALLKTLGQGQPIHPAPAADAAQHAQDALNAIPGITQAQWHWSRDEPQSQTQTQSRERERESVSESSASAVSRWTLTDPHHHPLATVALQGPSAHIALDEPLLIAAWSGWARLLAHLDRQQQILQKMRELARTLDAFPLARRAGGALSSSNTGMGIGIGIGVPQDHLEALAEFAAGAGHELNNPIAAILGRAQILARQTAHEPLKRDLQTIADQALRVTRILNDLMFIARPPRPRRRRCYPVEILRQSLRDLAPRAQSARIPLHFEEPPAAVTGVLAVSDPDGLRHLADELLTNALEATPPNANPAGANAPAIRVRVERTSQHLIWILQDQGVGMSPEYLRRIFDPFFCGREAGRGRGLGLPRAARFAAQVGIDFHIASQPKIGTSVHILIPVSPKTAHPA